MKRYGVILSILIIIQIVLTSFHKAPDSYNAPIKIEAPEIQCEETQSIDSSEISQTNYTSFTTHLAVRESSNRYWIMNRYGYMGKYQFGRLALRDVGIRVSRKHFLSDSCLQEEAMLRYLKVNEKRLKPYLERYLEREIKGIKITRSGLLAGAHLGGAGGVKKFLKTNGRVDRRDGNGTRISDYIRAFGGYEFKLNDVAI